MDKKEEYENKKKQKQAEKEQQRRAAQKKDMKKKLGVGAAIGGALLVVVVLIVLAVRSNSPENLSGTFVQTQGGEHVSAPYTNPPYEWNTNPPTGGWHDPQPLSAGFYEEKPSVPRAIHSMEHGAVIVWYKPSVPEEDKQKLSSLFNRHSGDKFIVMPYEDMETDFAVTAWEWIDTFDTYDEERIERFFEDHHNQGPERAPIGSHQ